MLVHQLPKYAVACVVVKANRCDSEHDFACNHLVEPVIKSIFDHLSRVSAGSDDLQN